MVAWYESAASLLRLIRKANRRAVNTIAEHTCSLATEAGRGAGTGWHTLLEREEIDVIVATTPDKYPASITMAALSSAHHPRRSVRCLAQSGPIMPEETDFRFSTLLSRTVSGEGMI